MNINYLRLLFCAFVVSFVASFVSAQQLPDPGFEDWSGGAFDGSAQLKDWHGSNVQQTYLGITARGTMVKKAAGAHSGSACAKIENVKVAAGQLGEEAPAWLTLGTPFADISNGISGATAGTYGGIAFTYRPDTMAVWVKRTGGNAMNEDMNLVYYSWIGTNSETRYASKSDGCVNIPAIIDEESDIRVRTDKNSCQTHNTNATQVAEGFYRNRIVLNDWTEIKVPINYYTNDVPQKLNVILSAGNYPNFRANSGIYSGNALFVDDIRLIYSSKVQEMYFNNRKVSAFDPAVPEFTYSLGLGASQFPSIELRRSGRILATSEYTVNYGNFSDTPTTITVRAEDGSSTTTYTVHFVAELSKNPRLAGINVNGTPVANFNGYVNNYNVELPFGTTTLPTIEAVKAESAQTVEITNCTAIPGSATVKVFAEDKAYSQTYTLNFTLAKLTDNTLKDILINGKSLTGFLPTKTTYVVEMPIGTTENPTITPVSAYEDGLQTIVVDNQGLNGKSTVKVTPAGGTNTRTYTISYKITESSYSFLKSIKIGGVELPNFDPEKTSYDYALPLGTTVLPAITWEKGDEYQTVTKEEGGIDGVTKITVTAQNGSITIYRITFSTAKSSNATLADLKVGGETIDGFSGDKFNYTYELPIGTTALPAITYTAGDAYQTINLIQGGVNGTTKIIVKAQNGTTNTYNIVFSVAQADNTTLKSITVGGVEIPNFASNVYEYDYLLPRGTTALPEIAYTKHDEFQTVTVRKGGVNGDTKITVRAQTGASADYTIHFSVEISSNGLLQAIFVNGEPLAGFEPNKFDYSVNLPVGTTAEPVVTYAKGDDYQTVTIDKGGLNGTTTILVVSEDKSSKNSYAIHFSVAQANVSTLADLQIDGVTIEGFSPETFEYSVLLPRGTNVLPTITAVAHDQFQTIRQTSGGVNGDTKIVVRAQTGATSTYIIHFSVEKSNNSQLADIQINGVSLEGFESEKTEYAVELESGTTELPAITYTKGDEMQSVFVQKAGIEGVTTLRVVAENGNQTTYSIAFSVKKSENAFLKNIFVDGTPLADFDKTDFDYIYILDASATACPAISVEKEDGQTVSITSPKLLGTAKIVVTPEFGANNVYTITFKFNQSNNSTLSGLTIGGETVADFDANTLNYNYLLPSGTTVLPEIGFTKGDETQNVTVIRGELNGESVVRVEAEDGSETLYTITFAVEKSQNAALQNILVDGSPLTDFLPETLNYNYILPRETTVCPQIEVVKAVENQTICIVKPNLEGKAQITVLPEEGFETVYTINFAFELSENALLNDILLGGTSLEGFAAETFNYAVTLPNGTTELPEISVVQGDDYQKVLVLKNGVNGTTTIDVKAENGTVLRYEIAFAVEKSSDASLQTIKIAGVEVADFQADKLTYDYVLADGTTVCPQIEAVKNHAAQTVSTLLPNLAGEAKIAVTAEDGTQKIYTISLTFEPKNNANLSGITVAGEPLAAFDAETTDYIVDLAFGTELPEILAQKGDETQTILTTITENGTQFLVTAQNGDQKSYTVTFNIAKSDNALLSDIQLADGQQFVSLENFESTTHFYTKTLAWRTKTVPAVLPISAENGQTVTIHYNNVNDTTKIHVVAADGTTAADYKIFFEVEKSALTALSSIEVDGAELNFDPEILTYNVILPYGTQKVPQISWTKGEQNGKIVDEQQVTSTIRSLAEATEIAVTAENGDTQTYELRFEVTPSAAENVLVALNVYGVGNLLEGSDETTFTVELPYGTTQMPTIDYAKNFDEQSVLVVNGGIYSPTVVTVKSNREGDADKVYTIVPNVAKYSPAVLNAISANGAGIADFSPDKFNYVLSCTAKPTILYQAPANVNVVKTVDNSKQVQLTVTTANEEFSNVYNIYFYYENDKIPNGEFTQWTTPKYNASRGAVKPTGWNVPADAAESKYVFIIGTDYTGPEVTNNSNNFVVFKTKYGNALGGPIPAVATIGNISCELAVNGKTAVGFSGGITYRNTPDFANIRYDYKTKKGNGALFAFRFDGENRDFVRTSQTNGWTLETHALNTSELSPNQLSVIINATNNEIGGNALAGNIDAELWVDYIRFVHSSKISQLLINGVPVSNFNGDVASQTLDIDADFQGVPQVSVVGEVPDQEHTIALSPTEIKSGNFFRRSLNIGSKAEDGTKTNYILTLRRPLSSNKKLANLYVAGEQLSGFAPTTYAYNVAWTAATLPDITAFAGSEHQTITIAATSATSATITVAAENGETQDYVLNFVDEKANSTALKSLEIVGKTDFVYNAETTEYTVNLAANEALPEIRFEKNSDKQTVIFADGETATLKVIALSGENATYTINFVRETVQSHGYLTKISNDGTLLNGFEKTNFEYILPANSEAKTAFVRENIADKVTQTITAEAIVWNVEGSEETQIYTLNLAKMLSENTSLANILVAGVPLAQFNAAVFEYEIESNETLDLQAVCSEKGQTVATTFARTEGNKWCEYRFAVTAENGTSTQTTVVYLRKIKSSNALLKNILIDGETVAESGEFAAETFDYTITLPCENPKIALPQMPNIEVVKVADSQVVELENNGINRTSYITVTAENGSENIYSLTINSEKSSNANLTEIAVNNEKIADFSSENLRYTVVVPRAAVPTVTYAAADKFQKNVNILATKDSVTLEVTAENGNTKTYTVILATEPLSTSASLSNLTLDGVELAGFAPETLEYEVILPLGTEILPTINAAKANDNQIINIETGGVNGETTISVTAEDCETQQVYTIKFAVEKSTNALLDAIFVDYQAVADFVPTTFDYSVELTKSETPTIAFTRGDKNQTVKVEISAEKATLTVVAQNGDSVKYVVNFVKTVSDNALLANILIDNVSVENFAPETLIYNILLPVATTTLPDIATVAGDEGQTISLVAGGVRGTTTVAVTAADGVSQTVYQLIFDVEKSNIDTLKMIYLDGEELPEFVAATTDYNVILPVGTRQIPFITFEIGDAQQTAVLDTVLMDIANYSAQFHIDVTAENGNTNRYVLNFTIAKSEIDTLKMIYSNNDSIAEFAGENEVYNLTLPVGTRTLPAVTYDKADEWQTVKIDTISNEKYAKQVNLTVVSESGSSRVYEVHFAVEKSAVDTLKNLRINGAAIAQNGDGYAANADFDAQTLEYELNWAIGTQELPVIDWVAGDSLQQIAMNKTIETLDDEIIVTVTAENGNQKSYKIANKLLHSAVDTLKMIYLDGEELTNFAAETTEYNVILPVGTRQMPTVDFDKGDEWQTVEKQIVTEETYASVVKLNVAAEDGLHNNVYTLNFAVEKSAVDTLKTIFVGGLPLENFAANTHEYSYLLPNGTTELPEISWEAGDNFQTIDTISNGINGAFAITVTAENGNTATYTINFAVEKSKNADLEGILVAGEPIPTFDSEVLDYVVKLPYGATAVPEITFVKGEENQQVTVENAATLADKTTLKVVAEDGETTQTYTIGFEVSLSDNALLKNIFINGDALLKTAENFVADVDFSPENFMYHIVLPYGTTEKPSITWETQVADYESITLDQSDEIAGISKITVVSQDGTNSNDYELVFTIEKSNNCSLLDLKINGESLEGFDAETLVYTLVYPVGADTTALPTAADITFTVGDATQSVVVSQADPTVILITVTAENGDVQVYVVEMEIELSDNSLLKDILLNGVSLRDFAPTTYEYEYLLFLGDTIPAISVVKGEEKQEIFITHNQIGDYTYIYVVAEDLSETEYRILFRYSDETTSSVPTIEDVSWLHIGGGLYKASTRKENVSVAIFDTSGRLVTRNDVTLVDANDRISDASAAGTRFQFEKRGRVYICVFYHEGTKRIIKSEKFIY